MTFKAHFLVCKHFLMTGTNKNNYDNNNNNNMSIYIVQLLYKYTLLHFFFKRKKERLKLQIIREKNSLYIKE